MTPTQRTPPRETIFVTHAAPEDNEFALWIASKLAMAGYRVWVDRRRLRGGDDFWDEIDRVLRNEAIKQVVVFTKSVSKPGVKKELAIGEVMKQRLSDPTFMIPIRADTVAFSDAPPEFLRGNILDAHPNWHDSLKDLFETLEGAGVPKTVSPDATILRSIVETREDGRRFVLDRPEDALTNWFPITTPPETIRYFKFEGLQGQMRSWLKDCSVPVVPMGRLAGSFCDPLAFSAASTFDQQIKTAYEIPFADFVSGTNLGPYQERSAASNDVDNLLRQHFAAMAKARGLKPVEFASGETGWYFPDDLISANRISFTTRNGRRIRRTVSGKFKNLRWHLCLHAKPRIWPSLVFRMRGNVVLSDNSVILPGNNTHKRRRRLTRSWWNDVWRDRLLAAMPLPGQGSKRHSNGSRECALHFGCLAPHCTASRIIRSGRPAPAKGGDEDGNIIPTAALDNHLDDLEGEEEPEDDEEVDS